MGPFTIEKGHLKPNPSSWTDTYSVLFVDNPIGTGYSYLTNSTKPPRDTTPLPETENSSRLDESRNEHVESIFDGESHSAWKPPANLDWKSPDIDSDQIVFNANVKDEQDAQYTEGFVNNQAAVSKDLYVFMTKFFALYPMESTRPFYITTESYGGKYVPSFAAYIHKQNLIPTNKYINLKGIVVGNGLVDPVSQVLYHSTFAYSLGLISTTERDLMDEAAKTSVYWVNQGDNVKALAARLHIFDIFVNGTGGLGYYDIRNYGNYDRRSLGVMMNREKIRKALNVPQGIRYAKDYRVFGYLEADIMRSTAHLFPYLIDEAKIKVMLMYGNMDFRDGILGSTPWIEGMDWQGKHEFNLRERKPFPGGWIKRQDNFRFVVIHNAGHLVPQDQFNVSFGVLQDFINA